MGLFFISGSPETGKSLIAMLMACTGPIHQIKKWNPTDPGDFFNVIYSKINPTEDKPLIVVLNEVDGIIEKIHKGVKMNTDGIDCEITNKKKWDDFFDEFADEGIYRNTILLMNSNKTKSFLDELDPAYIRPGRIDKCWEFTHKMIPSYAGVKNKEE